MTRVAVEPLGSEWCYEFVPSTALPLVDLSQSVKTRFFSESTLRVISVVVQQLPWPWVFGNVLGQLLAVLLGFVHAPAGRIVAIFVLVLGVPSYLANLSNMRFEIVRLVLREDNAVFMCAVNTITNVFIGVVFGDLRGLAAISNLIGWINVLVIDAQLMRIRHSVRLISFSMVVVSTLTACMFLNRIDQPHGVSLWQYRDGDSVYSVPATDYAVNGLSTLLILQLKIVYRKRESIHHADCNKIIKCVIIRCRTKLVLCTSAPNGGASKANNSASSTALQRLQFVPLGQIYDARRIMFPVAISSTEPFPRAFVVLWLALGCMGFGLWLPSSAFVNRRSNFNSATVDSQSTTETAVTMAAFACSAAFYLLCLACCQRELLKTLVSSFDFVFYSAQATTIHLIAAILYDWQRDYCVWLVTCWIWMHWVFCLDALTPLMRTKLRFHVRWAAPVTLVLLMGMSMLILGILAIGMNPPKGRVIWTGMVLGRAITIKVLPFFVSRLFFMLTWMLRLLIRLLRASNVDAIILRGSVQFENLLFRTSGHSRPLQSVVSVAALHPIQNSSPVVASLKPSLQLYNSVPR